MPYMAFAAVSGAQGFIGHLGGQDGAYVDRARNHVVRTALQNENTTHVMFLDQDMIIPQDTMGRLLSHDVGVVGGFYPGKDDWFTPVAFHLRPRWRRVYEFDELPMVPSPDAVLPDTKDPLTCVCGKPDDHLHTVGGTGMGVTLVSTEVFRKIRDHYNDHPCPCGKPECDGEMWFSAHIWGEDVHFAERLLDLGIDWHLDGFVQCGHARNQIVTRQHYEWAKDNAAKCWCGKVAFWHKDNDAGDRQVYCWEHSDQVKEPQ